MTATTKTELLAVTDKEYAKLATLLVDIDAAFALRSFENGWSIKDVVAQRALG